MNSKSLSFGLAIALAAAFTPACGGETPEPQSPEPPPAAAPEPAPEPMAEPAPAPVAEPAPAAEAPAAPAPLKERVVGKWTGSLAGEARTKAEEAAKKKAGKDEAKATELLQKDEEKAAKDVLELSADGTISMYEGDKLVSKVKYEVVREEGSTLFIKLTGKDEVTKKDAPKDEIAVTLSDDKTLEWKGPKATKTFSKK